MTNVPNASSLTPRRVSSRSARRRAREFALQGVYAWILQGGAETSEISTIDASLREEEDFAQADMQWFKTLLYGAAQEAPSLRTQFLPFIDRSLKELSPVEHAILLVASYELIHHLEVPYKVTINEAVELAKSFGGTDGFKFVNGVLDKLAVIVREKEVQAASRPRHA